MSDVRRDRHPRCRGALFAAVLASTSSGMASGSPAAAAFALAGEQIVAANGTDIAVPGYSVPSFVAWNGDGLPDLVVGEGGGASPDGKVRIYPNGGSSGSPAFDGHLHAQSSGVDLVVPGGG